MKHIIEKIKEYNTIIIHGHQRPDGDCLGSQYGLYYILKESFPDKRIYVTGEKSISLAFVGEPSLIDEKYFKGALSICVDTATSERLSDNRIDLAEYCIKIDHHIPIENYGDYQYVEIDSPATAQIITEICACNPEVLRINKLAANALYLGILTDTSRFKFETVTAKTFNMAGYLLERGVDLAAIDLQLSVDTLASLKLKGYVLSNFQVSENGFAYIIMKRPTIEEYGVNDEEAAAQVSTISTIEECPVWAIFMEYPGEIRIRLRSRGPIVNKLAEEYHGGGHAKASGGRLDDWDELAGFIAKADALVKKYKLESNN